MKTGKFTNEKGQSMLVVALLFMIIGGALALVLDGSTAYVAWRQAHKAADAGALAGASYMCEHLDAVGGVNKAVESAVNNGADNPPDVRANLSGGSIKVTATVQKDIFFPRVIGISQVSPRAVAEAHCP